jgi:hypothetical protein
MLKQNLNSLLQVVLVTMLILNSSSCTLILSKALGLKNPKVESFEEQKSYLKKYNLDTTNLYTFNPIYKDSLKLSTYYITYSDSIFFTPMQFRMYDSTGEFVAGWALCFGKVDVIGLYEQFPPKKLEYTNDKLNFYTDSNFILDRTGQKIDPKIFLNHYNYIIVGFWAEWLGRLSKDMLIDLENYIQKYNEKNIIFLKVNLGNPTENKKKE